MLRPLCYGVKLVKLTLPSVLLKMLAVQRAREDATKRVSKLFKRIGHLAEVADSQVTINGHASYD